MTGAEHYQRAEQLEALAIEEWERGVETWRRGRVGVECASFLLARAQVHATLALAAATDSTLVPRVRGAA